MDLNTPFEGKRADPFGAIDAKITEASLARSSRAEVMHPFILGCDVVHVIMGESRRFALRPIFTSRETNSNEE